MVALCSRADRYIFILFLSFFFFSSPNLSGRRLDVYHALAHGVALVRIWNADLKCAARGSLQIQDAKNRHLGTIARLCRAISLCCNGDDDDDDDTDGSRQSSATRLRSVEDVGDGPYQMSTAQQHSGTILCPAVFFLILAFVFGSRPSDHYFRSVCWFVCLPVCLFVGLFVQFISAVFDPISIKLGHMLYVWV